MSRIVEPLDRAFTVEVASIVEAAHQPRADGTCRRCLYCTSAGCERMTWAAPILAEHRQRRAVACRP
ncbi:hypothetical protein ACIBBG_32735 [Micromonospora chersina]|uniref:hypothetical protein n=1 Tax=Micromonospora chersina TaxID=47854 RepID=UPI0037926012